MNKRNNNFNKDNIQEKKNGLIDGLFLFTECKKKRKFEGGEERGGQNESRKKFYLFILNVIQIKFYFDQIIKNN